MVGENIFEKCENREGKFFDFFPDFFSDRKFYFFSELKKKMTYHIDQKFSVLSISGTFKGIRALPEELQQFLVNFLS